MNKIYKVVEEIDPYRVRFEFVSKTLSKSSSARNEDKQRFISKKQSFLSSFHTWSEVVSVLSSSSFPHRNSDRP